MGHAPVAEVIAVAFQAQSAELAVQNTAVGDARAVPPAGVCGRGADSKLPSGRRHTQPAGKIDDDCSSNIVICSGRLCVKQGLASMMGGNARRLWEQDL